MKIQAKDLKIGQDVKFGNQWMKVEKLENETLKNGKGVVRVCGTVYAATIKGGYGYRSRKVKSCYSDYNTPKLETIVTVR